MDVEQEEYCNPNESISKNNQCKIKCLWDNCSQVFLKLEELANHVNDEHVKIEKEGDFSCRWNGCSRKGRSFNARYKMLIHVRTHTNEKPHMCRLCGKSFSRLENLKIHNRSHTGEKPYICPVEGCDKAYSNSSDRFKHTRTHFVDKPYFCKKDGCNKRYTDPSSLRKHMKTYGHHREDRTCIIKLKKESKQCNGPACSWSGISSSNATVKSFLPSNGSLNKISKNTLSISPVLTVSVPALICNPLFTADLLKSPHVKFESYLTQTNGKLDEVTANGNDIQRNDVCPLDLTIGHQECSVDPSDT